MSPKKNRLVLVRHGESRLNKLNRFSGWLDVPLSKQGLKEAEKVAAHCGKNFTYDAAFTSELERAQETLLIILSHQPTIGLFQHPQDRRYNPNQSTPNDFLKKTIPIFRTEKMNERYYGRLQGMKKEQAEEKYGPKQIFSWRRGFADRPPGGESLEDVSKRIIPYFEKNIHPRTDGGNQSSSPDTATPFGRS